MASDDHDSKGCIMKHSSHSVNNKTWKCKKSLISNSYVNKTKVELVTKVTYGRWGNFIHYMVSLDSRLRGLEWERSNNQGHCVLFSSLTRQLHVTLPIYSRRTRELTWLPEQRPGGNLWLATWSIPPGAVSIFLSSCSGNKSYFSASYFELAFPVQLTRNNEYPIFSTSICHTWRRRHRRGRQQSYPWVTAISKNWKTSNSRESRC